MNAPRAALRATLLAAAAAGAAAGIGYSTLRLNPCSQSPAFLPYQVWTYNATSQQLLLADGVIFRRPHAPVDALGPAVANASLWTSPGNGLKWTLAADGSATPIAAAGAAAGLCITLADAPQPGVGVWLQPCAPGGAPAQTFKVVAPGGAIVHAASGLCLDAGAAVLPCQPGGAGSDLPFCNASLPVDARVDDLVGRLSVLEKASMLDSTGGGSGRLGVAGYQVRASMTTVGTGRRALARGVERPRAFSYAHRAPRLRPRPCPSVVCSGGTKRFTASPITWASSSRTRRRTLRRFPWPSRRPWRSTRRCGTPSVPPSASRRARLPTWATRAA
jgi:hypothetical protein